MNDSYEEPGRCGWCGEWCYPGTCPTCGTVNLPAVDWLEAAALARTTGVAPDVAACTVAVRYPRPVTS